MHWEAVFQENAMNKIFLDPLILSKDYYINNSRNSFLPVHEIYGWSRVDLECKISANCIDY